MITLTEHFVAGVLATTFSLLLFEWFKTTWFEYWVSRKIKNTLFKLLNWLQNVPKQIDFGLINSYLKDDEIFVHQVLDGEPVIDFVDPPPNPLTFDQTLADQFRDEQAAADRPDDPHVIVNSSTLVDSPLLVSVVRRYSELRAAARGGDFKRLILGATTLVIRNELKNEESPYLTKKHLSQTPALFLQVRGNVETESSKLHAFGGGYMPYVLGGSGATTRRDDRKSLLRTASRELEEESGIHSERHLQNAVIAVAEGHSRHQSFGYLTYAFFLPLAGHDKVKPNWEGQPYEVSIVDGKPLVDMIVDAKYFNNPKGIPVHPQLRAILYVWIGLGMPGLSLRHRIFKGINPGRLFAQINEDIKARLAHGK